MSIDKAEIKIATAHEIGVRMDDALEAAKRDVAVDDGARAAAIKIAADLEGLLAAMNKQVNEEGGMDLETAKTVGDWLQKAVGLAKNMVMQAERSKILAQGRVQAFESAVAGVMKFKTEEENKVRSLLDTVKSGDIEDAGRPPPSIKSQRLAEKRVRRAKNT